MTVVIINCSKKKNSGKMMASDLYCGKMFKGALKYAKTYNRPIFILSAKYGLIQLDDVIEDYNLKITMLNKAEKLKWTKLVLIQWRILIKDYESVVFLCSEEYSKLIIPNIRNKYLLPLKGLTMGYQLQFFTNNV
jgi:cytoplasmic iron level regulating protein YaaA (DUF328/UPF0246 family)